MRYVLGLLLLFGFLCLYAAVDDFPLPCRIAKVAGNKDNALTPLHPSWMTPKLIQAIFDQVSDHSLVASGWCITVW
eukprot:436163-Amphidinium_carterae.1